MNKKLIITTTMTLLSLVEQNKSKCYDSVQRYIIFLGLPMPALLRLFALLASRCFSYAGDRFD